MFFKLIILFIVLPILEMWLIVKLAGATSWGMTFLVVLGTGILGSAMARRQGWKIWRRINEALKRGEIPAQHLLDGLLLLIGGVLLITPGLITDTVGFLLLIPFTRALIREHVKKWFKHSIQQGTTRFYYHSEPEIYDDEDVIDVEWEEQEKPGPERQLEEE